jgi:crotonobetainyl-CoA:carnitine CoA-transferase CaiB-like acyl-CoA transferase
MSHPNGPLSGIEVLDLSAYIAGPYGSTLLAEGLVATFEHPLVGRYRGMANPIHFGASMPSAPFAAPTAGQHTNEILAAYDFSAEEIENLRQAKVILPTPSDPDQGKE